MKALLLSAVVAFLGLSTSASAQETPSYNLTTAFLLAKCSPATDENGNNVMDCQNDASSIMNKNQVVPMTCNSSQCMGSWTGTLTVQGTAYTGTVHVLQNTSVDGVVTTDITGNVSNCEAVLSVNPTNNIVTDVAALLGRSINSTTEAGVQYVLAIAVAPANVATPALRANVMHKIALLKK